MRIRRFTVATLLAVLASAHGVADEKTLLASFDAFTAAMNAGRFVEADAPGMAAWREAETVWGATEDTAVLAFNVARLRLMLDRRADAREPALRVLELVGMGKASSISREEAGFFVAFSQFGDGRDRGELAALEESLQGYEPKGSAERRIATNALVRIAVARGDRENWEQVFAAATRAGRLMAEDRTYSNADKIPVMVLAARAAYRQRQIEAAWAIIQVAIGTYPPQPLDKPIDPLLADLLAWEGGLRNAQRQAGGTPLAYSANVGWDDPRQQAVAGCPLEWIERRRAAYPGGGAITGIAFGVIVEYYLRADGTVERAYALGNVSNDGGFRDVAIATVLDWRAKPNDRVECGGPWRVFMSFNIE